MGYLSDKDFFATYGRVPRLGVDLVIQSPQGIVLALRAIEPSEGFWHLPGGTVYKGETIAEAALRIAKKETGLTVTFDQCLGYMEFLKEIRSGKEIHTVSIVIRVTPLDNTLVHDADAKEIGYFATLPEQVIKEHAEFLKNTIKIN